MATLQRFARPCRQIFTHYTRSRGSYLQSRAISASEKKTDVPTTMSSDAIENSQEYKDLKQHFGDANPEKLKNWTSFGWNYEDREDDTFNANLVYFSLFTVALVCCGYFLAYTPDFKLRDWVMREAYLELDRREKAGLPLVDPYFVPPEQVELPSDEELGDTEIIV